MSITQDGSGKILYTPPPNKWRSDLSGTVVDNEFAVVDDQNVLKQVQFSVNPTTTAKGTLTLQCDVAGDNTINLTTMAVSGPFPIAAGTAANPPVDFVGATTSGLFGITNGMGVSTNGTERARIDSNGYFGVNTASAAGALHVKAVNTSLSGGLSLEGNGSDASNIWNHYVRSSDSTYFIYNPNANNSGIVMQSNGLTGFGPQSPDWTVDINGSNSSTSPATLPINTKGVLGIRNIDTTSNNFSAIAFQGGGGNHQWDSMIAGVHEVHSNTPTGHLRFYTNNSGAVTEAFRIKANSNLMFAASQYTTGAGIAGLGTNSPASSLTSPNTWLKFEKSDNTVVYVPAWA